MNISGYLKDRYNIMVLPDNQQIMSWYLMVNELRQQGYSSFEAGELAARKIFKSFIVERRSFEVKTHTDDIDAILNVIKGQIK